MISASEWIICAESCNYAMTSERIGNGDGRYAGVTLHECESDAVFTPCRLPCGKFRVCSVGDGGLGTPGAAQ